MATHFHSLRVKDIRRETNECVSIAFEIPENVQDDFKYVAGQNLTVRILVGDEEIRRSYSICSSPLDNELRIAVKKIDAGKFSTYVNEHLNIGDHLDVLPPSGKFNASIVRNVAGKYLAVAAGSGITPILSIIKTTLLAEPSSRFTLIYGNRNRSSIIFREQLEALKNKFMSRLIIHHVLSREVTDSEINYGRINAEKCEQFNKGLVRFIEMDEIFLCGPAEMIFSVRDWLNTMGIEKTKIHFELFGSPADKGLNTVRGSSQTEASTSISSKVTIRLDGISIQYELAYEGLSILDASLKQGADLPYACKGGVCATCKAKLTEGNVEMYTNYALEPDEVEAGYILTCQSHPRSEVVVVDFDAK